MQCSEWMAVLVKAGDTGVGSGKIQPRGSEPRAQNGPYGGWYKSCITHNKEYTTIPIV